MNSGSGSWQSTGNAEAAVLVQVLGFVEWRDLYEVILARKMGGGREVIEDSGWRGSAPREVAAGRPEIVLES